jgi:DNA-binding PadR family transcriptional regulator
MRRSLVGLYALTLMEREGPLHGYRLSERIAESTRGTWRPGAGAVYPALRRLVTRGLATPQDRGRRKVYRVTPAGRRLLRLLRSRQHLGGTRGPDATLLWAEVMGLESPEALLLFRLRRALEGIEGYLTGALPAGRSEETFRLRVRQELFRALEQVDGKGSLHPSHTTALGSPA